ncbi:AurF N-oxygenase family protein [Actinophytocola sediminis]
MARVRQPKDREVTAERLLDSSVRNSYAPDVDIDWAAPLAEGKAFMPLERVSLYGTELWERLTPEQRIELSKHEIASMASVGLWFEIVLMQLLARYIYDLDPTTAHAQYALTELGDETRHSIMFAKAVKKTGAPAYGPNRVVRALGRVFGGVAGGPPMFASVLVAEETTDRVQRSMMDDPEIQPMIRMVNRIHVIEEARHVRFAREEVVRGLAGVGRVRLEFYRLVTAVTAYAVVDCMVHPKVYAAVGIDPREGRRVALANPHHQEHRRWMSEKVVEFLTEVGLIGGPSKAIWKHGYMI